MLITTTLVGLNSITPSIGGQNWLIAIFMTILSAVTLLASLIGGFSNGYNSIAVSSTGVYKTAISFIKKADAYCQKYNKQLRHTVKKTIDSIPTELVKDVKSNEIQKTEEVNADQSQITMNIFDNLLK